MSSLVAIPVYNEARHVDDVLDEVRSLHEHVLVIDDGSTDQTPALLDRRSDIHLIRHAANRGYGQSMIDAFDFARRYHFQWLITMDCDRQHQPAQITQFLAVADTCDCDLVSGSRYLMELPSNDDPPPDRQSINRFITQMLNRLLGLRLTDSFCGYKAYRVESLQWITPTVTGYAFPMQVWVQVARAGFKLHEMPVPLIYPDKNRHFGGLLDDADHRRQHYVDTILEELVQPQQSPSQMMRLGCDWPRPPINPGQVR